MSKAAQTRAKIVAKAAPIFNQHGYGGTSISDVMQATGLKKGGIYNHFDSKDELALAAFDYAVDLIKQRYALILKEAAGDRIAQLLGIVNVFSSNAANPPVAGGCPLLNTAVESDDTHPALRERVRMVMDEWHDLIKHIVAKGIASGEFYPDVDGAFLATIIVATIEGALMQSKLYGDNIHMERAVAHLTKYLKDNVIK
jgi:AcrR family transcriptional regulator